ncbi:hypothetical protein HC928_12640 [bacterium]|nr:hypothetical protein [bacterium]
MIPITITDSMPLDAAFTLTLMIESRRERAEGWRIDLVEQFPPLFDLLGDYYLGGYSWSNTADKHKLMLLHKAHDYGGGYASPADIARDYIRVKYPKPLRCRTDQYHEVVKKPRYSPLYARPIALGEAVYVDLKSAYWNILRAVGWSADYMPGKFLGVRDTVNDFPFPYIKEARNALATVSLPGKINVWRGGKLASIDSKQRATNIMVYALLQDVLHGIAHDMMFAGAHYVYTDGYILPTAYLDRAFEVAASWA